jgi:hypothetical protein
MKKYGIKTGDLAGTASELGKALNVVFNLQSSSYRGGDYFRAEVPEGTIYLQRNYDSLDNEPFEEAWPGDEILLCLDGIEDMKWARYLELLAPFEASGKVKFLGTSIS